MEGKQFTPSEGKQFSSIDSTRRGRVAVEEDSKTAEKKDDVGTVSMAALFKYATPTDFVLILLGAIGSVEVGLSQPIMIVLFADVMGAASGSISGDIE
jgi:hypothetical protein